MSKYGEAPPVDAKADEDKAKTKVKKPKKLQPKFSHELLLDHQKGMVSIYKNFPKLKFKGKGHEASDLRRLLAKCAAVGHPSTHSRGSARCVDHHSARCMPPPGIQPCDGRGRCVHGA